MSANFISMMERKEKYTHTHTKAPSSLFLQSPEPISQSRALFSLGEGAGELNAHPTALRPCVPGHEGKIFCRWLRNSPARNNKKKSPCLASPCMQPAAWALRMGQSLRGCCLGSILTTDCPRHPGDSQHQGRGMTFLHQIHPPKSCDVFMPSLQSVSRIQWEGKFSCSPDSGVNFIPDNGDNSATVHWLFKAQNVVQSCAHLLHLHLILPELKDTIKPLHLVKVTTGCRSVGCECVVLASTFHPLAWNDSSLVIKRINI